MGCGNGPVKNANCPETVGPDFDFSASPAGTKVNIKEIVMGGMSTHGAEIGSFNIAGVRLSVRDGRIEGSTADINPGPVKLKDGTLDDLKLAKPVFVVEPSGRYRNGPKGFP
jgi:hypothetical protein